jgi:hypothetical protein
MSEENLETLYQIRSELPVLRELETRRNTGKLSPEEEARWIQLYAGVLRLFGARHVKLLEQRKAMRVPLRTKVNFAIKGEQFYCMSHDISTQGLAVEFNHRIPEIAQVTMFIQIRPYRLFGLLRGPPLETKSVIRWRSVEANRIGFEFVDLQPNHRTLIEDTVFKEIEQRVQRVIKEGRLLAAAQG